MDYYSFTDPEGMEGWVGLVCWPIADTLPTKWSHVSHRSGVDQGKFAACTGCRSLVASVYVVSKNTEYENRGKGGDEKNWLSPAADSPRVRRAPIVWAPGLSAQLPAARTDRSDLRSRCATVETQQQQLVRQNEIAQPTPFLIAEVKSCQAGGS